MIRSITRLVSTTGSTILKVQSNNINTGSVTKTCLNSIVKSNNTWNNNIASSIRYYGSAPHNNHGVDKHNNHHDEHHGHGSHDYHGDPRFNDGGSTEHHDDEEPVAPSEWLMENSDTTILRHDHPGYPYSKLRDESLPVFTLEEISRHNKREDCWLLIHGKVYNVSSYIDQHPGGEKILAGAGRDCSTIFDRSQMTWNAWIVMKDYHIGYCDHVRRYDGITTPNRPGTHYFTDYDV